MKSYRKLTLSLPEITARWYGQSRGAPVRVIGIHTTECNEANKAAIAVAKFFTRLPSNRKASAHIVVDNKEAIRCVPDNKPAWAAPGCNFDGLHLELVGRANQTMPQWEDSYSQNVLKLGAKIVADWSQRFNIPVVKLTVPQLKAGKRGIVGHVDISRAYGLTRCFCFFGFDYCLLSWRSL